MSHDNDSEVVKSAFNQFIDTLKRAGFRVEGVVTNEPFGSPVFKLEAYVDTKPPKSERGNDAGYRRNDM